MTGHTVLSAEGAGIFVVINLSRQVTVSFGDNVILRYHRPGTSIPANYQLLLTFDDDSFLVAIVAMFGFINVYTAEQGREKYYALSRNSLSPLSDNYTEEVFARLFAHARKTVTAKALLATDQRIPGIGNGVVQDILFNAHIHPRQKVLLLSASRRKALFHALKTTLREMADQGGRDTWTDLFGNRGGYTTLLSARTYKEPCPCCGSPIVKEAYLGGSVYYCPSCQQLTNDSEFPYDRETPTEE